MRIEVENSFLQFKGVKCYLVMTVKMVKYSREGEEVIMDVVFNSELETMLLLSNFDLQFDKMIDAILQKTRFSSYFCIFLRRYTFQYRSKENCHQYTK